MALVGIGYVTRYLTITPLKKTFQRAFVGKPLTWYRRRTSRGSWPGPGVLDLFPCSASRTAWQPLVIEMKGSDITISFQKWTDLLQKLSIRSIDKSVFDNLYPLVEYPNESFLLFRREFLRLGFILWYSVIRTRRMSSTTLCDSKCYAGYPLILAYLHTLKFLTLKFISNNTKCVPYSAKSHQEQCIAMMVMMIMAMRATKIKTVTCPPLQDGALALKVPGMSELPVKTMIPQILDISQSSLCFKL